MPTPEELNRAGMDFYKQGKYSEAIEAYESAIALKPDHVPCYINLTHAYNKKGRPDDALRVALKAAELAPANGAVRHNLGNAQNAKGRWNEAVSAYSRAWEIDKTQINSIYMAGALCMDNGLDAKAVGFLKMYIAAAPADHPRHKEAEERLANLEGGSPLIQRY
jgi:tetratricopeptide (TPR) repeat protein